MVVCHYRGCEQPFSDPADSICSAASATDGGQVRIALIIMASDNSWKGAPDISLLQELVKALDHPTFYIIIHVDQNSSQQFKEAVAALTAGQTRTSLVKYPLGCTWAGQLDHVQFALLMHLSLFCLQMS